MSTSAPMSKEAQRAVESAFLSVLRAKTGKQWRIVSPDEDIAIIFWPPPEEQKPMRPGA